MIHCRFDVLKCRSRWMDGSATFTMEASSTTMNWPMQTMPRTTHDGTYRPGSSSTAVLALEFADMGLPLHSAFGSVSPRRCVQRRGDMRYSRPGAPRQRAVRRIRTLIRLSYNERVRRDSTRRIKFLTH